PARRDAADVLPARAPALARAAAGGDGLPRRGRPGVRGGHRDRVAAHPLGGGLDGGGRAAAARAALRGAAAVAPPGPAQAARPPRGAARPLTRSPARALPWDRECVGGDLSSASSCWC